MRLRATMSKSKAILTVNFLSRIGQPKENTNVIKAVSLYILSSPTLSNVKYFFLFKFKMRKTFSCLKTTINIQATK